MFDNSVRIFIFKIIVTAIITISTVLSISGYAGNDKTLSAQPKNTLPIITLFLLDDEASIPPDCNDTGDNDFDRLLNCVETNTSIFVDAGDTGTDPNNPDTDGDSINDGDEVLGTTAGLNLPGMGANPLKKNIFIEYDWFDDDLGGSDHTHRPSIIAINKVRAVFKNAPVVNPDGTMGVDVIQDYGQGGIFSGGNYIFDSNGFINGYLGGEFLEHKSINFSANRHGYFHYVIMPHQYANGTTASSGLAEINGDDFIVSSVWWYGNDQWVANTIVHELGHNLNLRHGGFENCNRKPNYNSVMNYDYQFPGVDSDCLLGGDDILNYSTGVRQDLNELVLNEFQGMCNNVPIDWNSNSVLESSVTYNINPNQGCSSEFSTLQDYNDWMFISYTGINDADGATPDGKLSIETVLCDNYPTK